jgi:hypothetical protein
MSSIANVHREQVTMIETYRHVLAREYRWQACNIGTYDMMGFHREGEILKVII